LVFEVSYSEWCGPDYVLKWEQGPPFPIISPKVRLAPMERVWSCLPDGSPRIRCSCQLVWLQVRAFRSIVLIFYDGSALMC
jgi:hypothetical protein